MALGKCKHAPVSPFHLTQHTLGPCSPRAVLPQKWYPSPGCMCKLPITFNVDSNEPVPVIHQGCGQCRIKNITCSLSIVPSPRPTNKGPRRMLALQPSAAKVASPKGSKALVRSENKPAVKQLTTVAESKRVASGAASTRPTINQHPIAREVVSFTPSVPPAASFRRSQQLSHVESAKSSFRRQPSSSAGSDGTRVSSFGGRTAVSSSAGSSNTAYSTNSTASVRDLGSCKTSITPEVLEEIIDSAFAAYFYHRNEYTWRTCYQVRLDSRAYK